MRMLLQKQLKVSVCPLDALILAHLRLVRRLARQAAQCWGESYADLLQVGCVGLVLAARRYNPNRNSFAAYALPYVRGYLAHYLRDKVPLVRPPRRLCVLAYRGRRLEEEAYRVRGCYPREEEVAQQLGVALPQWQQAKISQQTRYPVSLETPRYRSALVAQLVAPTPSAEQVALEMALTRLEADTREIIELVYFERQSLRRIARAQGLALTEAQAQLTAGLTQLRTLMMEEESC